MSIHPSFPHRPHDFRQNASFHIQIESHRSTMYGMEQSTPSMGPISVHVKVLTRLSNCLQSVSLNIFDDVRQTPLSIIKVLSSPSRAGGASPSLDRGSEGGSFDLGGNKGPIGGKSLVNSLLYSDLQCICMHRVGEHVSTRVNVRVDSQFGILLFIIHRYLHIYTHNIRQ
jgi:hypothetical protein